MRCFDRRACLPGSAGLIALALLLAPAVRAQDDAPAEGDWIQPGPTCVAGFTLTLPEGVEGLPFGLGMEFRTTDDRELGEFVTGSMIGAPTIDGFVEGMVGDGGCQPYTALSIEGPQRVEHPTFEVFRTVLTCEVADGQFGLDIARIPFNQGTRVALFLLIFGDVQWQAPGGTLPAARVLPYDQADPLFDAMIASLSYCDAPD